MRSENIIQKLIGHLNLLHIPSAGNDNIARPENAHRNPLTLSYSIPRTLTLTEPRTGTNTRRLIRRIVVELGIHPLVNRLLQHTEDAVFFHQNTIQILLLHIVVQRVVRINHRDGCLGNRRLLFGGNERTPRKPFDNRQEPLNGLYSELQGRYPRHLNAAGSEEFHIDLLPSYAKRSSQNQGRLVIEGLGRHLAIRKEILVARPIDLLLMLELQNAGRWIADGNEVLFELLKEDIELNR